jgi:methyl-accepting chemotaxis protein
MGHLLRRARLRNRLLASFGVLTALIAAVAFLGVYQAGQQQRITGEVSRLAKLNRDVMQLKFRDADVSGWQIAYAWDVPTIGGRAATADQSPNRKGFLDSAGALDKEIASVPVGELTPAEADLFKTIKDNLGKFLEIDKQVVALFKQEAPATTKQANELIVGTGYEAYFKVLDSTAKLTQSVEGRSNAAQAQADRTAAQSRTLFLGSLVFTLVVAVALALLVTTSVVEPVRRVAAGLRLLANRDLSARLDDDGSDELADMSRAFNDASGAMRDALTGVGERAATLTGASQELSALSERMDGQATSTSSQASAASNAAEQVSGKVSTVASAAEEMTVSIQEIARSTASAVAVAADAVTSTEATSTAVGQLSAASTEIGQIVKTIAPRPTSPTWRVRCSDW